MKIKKRYGWICVAVVFLSMVAIVVWSCWSEYGSGYSEDQRRNWNEMVAKTSGKIVGWPRTYSEAVRQCYFSLPASVLLERQKQPDSPEWKPDFSEKGEPLPLEGMSILALKDLADKGDADACLELVFRSFNDSIVSTNQEDFSFPTLETVYQTEKYLKRALELNRPGAEFLFHLFECRKKGDDDIYLRDLNGYTEFLNYLDQGDFFLGKVYLHLNMKGQDCLDRLACGLEKKKNRGDIVALRNAAHFELLKLLRGSACTHWGERLFFKRYDDSDWFIFRDKVQRYSKTLDSMLVPVLKRTLKKEKDALLNFLYGQEWKETQHRLDLSLSMLWKAASQGDLHAKYLWCSYIISSPHVFSREEWEVHLRYADELLKAGGIYADDCWMGDLFRLEYFFYREDSRKLIGEVLKKKRYREYASFFHGTANDLILRMRACASISTGGFAQCCVDQNFLYETYSEEDKKYAYKLLEQAAKDGHPHAILCFARLLNQGGIISIDAHRAWDFVSRLKKWNSSIRGEVSDRRSYSYLYEYPNRDVALVSFWTPGSVEMMECDIVSRHGDMPGMAMDQAYNQFLLLDAVKDEPRPEEEKTWLLAIKAQFEKRGYKEPVGNAK